MLLAVCHRFAFELEVRFRSDALIRCKVCTPALPAFWPGAAASLCCRRKPVLTAARKNFPASGRRVTGGRIVREAPGVNLGAHLGHARSRAVDKKRPWFTAKAQRTQRFSIPPTRVRFFSACSRSGSF